MPGFVHVVATLSPEYMCPNRTDGDAATVCQVVVWVEIETTDQELQCYEVRGAFRTMHATNKHTIRKLQFIQSNVDFFMYFVSFWL